MQTKKHSLAESIANVLVGYTVAVCSQILIFPFFDVHIPIEDNAIIGLWFTAISIGRSYALRRWFTMRTERTFIKTRDAQHQQVIKTFGIPSSKMGQCEPSDDITDHQGFEVDGFVTKCKTDAEGHRVIEEFNLTGVSLVEHPPNPDCKLLVPLKLHETHEVGGKSRIPRRKMEVHASWDYSFSYSGSEYICRHTLWVGAAFPHKKAEFSVYSNKCDYIAARLRMDRLNRFHLRPAYRKTLQFTCRQLRKKARHAWRMILKTIEKGGSK